MKISQIAARLRKVASDLDAAAEKSDYDFPDDMVLPLIQTLSWTTTWFVCSGKLEVTQIGIYSVAQVAQLRE